MLLYLILKSLYLRFRLAEIVSENRILRLRRGVLCLYCGYFLLKVSGKRYLFDKIGERRYRSAPAGLPGWGPRRPIANCSNNCILDLLQFKRLWDESEYSHF